MLDIACNNCGKEFPAEGVPYRCLCGGVWGLPRGIAPVAPDITQIGIWQHRASFGLPDTTTPISLGEGATPLLSGRAFDKHIAFKMESQNPTGSYKDRGSAILASWLLARGVREAVEDSSGNAGASFAAYAARAGISSQIFVPASAAGPKRGQIEAYGARLNPIEGPRSAAADAVQAAAAAGAVYASHAYLPFGLPGIATIAYELYEQLGGRAPGALLAPVGHGSLLLGIAMGFEALLQAGKIDTLPKLIGVQARACAPLWALSTQGYAGLAWVTEGETLAEGVRVRQPLRGDALLAAVERNGGQFLAIEENEILPARDALASAGLFVEPTSAIVWAGLAQVADILPGPIVLVMTGSGLKAL